MAGGGSGKGSAEGTEEDVEGVIEESFGDVGVGGEGGSLAFIAKWSGEGWRCRGSIGGELDSMAGDVF
jgi:hypothetical protein